jgi:murein L,D-transpeptidase YcbB/YkuD
LAPALAAASLALAGCAATMPGAPPAAKIAAPLPEPEPEPTFQDHLDRLGVPLDLPQKGRALVVNIPAFEVIGFRDGKPDFRSRVIVGTKRDQTPILSTETYVVRFRPTWRPTPEMVQRGEYEDRRWPAGPKNPLGLAAVRFEPGLLIYFHDTNRKKLFDREMRALSHGCIRTEKWDELISWILDMPLEDVHAKANGSRTVDEEAPPIPVIIGYYLTFPAADGSARTYEDVYGFGRSLGPVESGPVYEPAPERPVDYLRISGTQL